MAPVWHRYYKRIIIIIVACIHILSVSALVYAKQEPDVADMPISVPPDSSFATPTISGIPVSLSVPSLGLNINILPGEYSVKENAWTLSPTNAHFASVTRPANNAAGNTFIYGHNNKHVFSAMIGIKPGAELILYTDNGNQFRYILETSRTVDPTDVSLFRYTGSPIVTIQTCTGAWFEKRGLYQFKLTETIESQQSLAIRTEAQRQELIKTLSIPLNPTFTVNDKPEVTAPQFAESQPAVLPDRGNIADSIMTMRSLINIDKPLFQTLSVQG